VTTPTIAEFRAAQYPDLDAVFLNSASHGLLARETVEAVTSLTRRRNLPLGIPDSEPGEALRRARAASAALLGVDAREITLAPNTSYGINLAAALVRAGPPGRIVVSAGEFPANVLPWLPLEAEGFGVEVVPTRDGLPDEGALLDAASRPGTRAVSVSAVQFASGFRADLAAFGTVCRDTRALFVVDAIQALGAVPLAPRELGIDVLATGGQKWLCAPWGSGFAWVAPEHHEHLRPPVVSWLAVEGGAAFSAQRGYHLDYLNDGRRYELATLGVQDYLGLARSLELLLDVGISSIRSHLLELHAPVFSWADSRDDVRILTPRDPERRAGILALALPDAHAACLALEREGIRATVREGLLRLAPHVYVTRSDMERVVEVLERALAAGSPRPG
jgi:selenocysteine lyase/cysteine desulfurase